MSENSNSKKKLEPSTFSHRAGCRGWLIPLMCVLIWAAPAPAREHVDWQFYRSVTIDNTANPNSLHEYQVKVELTSANFDFDDAQSYGEDLRFLADDYQTALDHWVETWDPVAESAVIWVELPEIPAGGLSSIFLLHGNPDAVSVGDGDDTFLFFDSFEAFNVTQMNAPEPLLTPTYDGSGQVVHPDIVRIPGGWRGYEYWMAMTPYPDGDNEYENPSVIVSHDGITWLEPPGITNPLVPTPSGWNNDPDMLLVDGRMMIYYNETNSDGNNYMSLLTSTDGVNWTGPTTVFTRSNYVMSPTVLHEDGMFYMWYVHSPGGCTSSYQNVYLRTSCDGVNWGDEQAVVMNQAGRLVWHFDVLKTDGKYVMLYASYPEWSSCAHTSLFYAESLDRLNWSTDSVPVLTPSPTGWDADLIYRSSFLMEGSALRIWYSARSPAGQWRVGYSEGDLAQFHAAHQQKWDEISGYNVATDEHPRSGVYGLRQIGGGSYPGIFKNIGGDICFSAWMYDDLGAAGNRLNVLRVWDTGTDTYPQHAIGVGVYTGQSTINYAYHGEGWQYTSTDLPRSVGWHKLSIQVRDSACDLLIDDQIVTELAVLDEQDISLVSLEGYLGAEGWFDDAYVRRFTSPEPSTTVGPMMPVGVCSNPPPGGGLLASVVLEQNFPNPANPGTEISFVLAKDMLLRLRIIDLRGRTIQTLIREQRPAGRHTVFWDGRDARAKQVASGIYLYQLDSAEETVSRKLILLK